MNPNYDYDNLISETPVKYTKVQIPNDGVWLKLEEGIPEDNVLFQFVECKITEDGLLQFKLDIATPELPTERLYEYAAKIISQDLKATLAKQ